MCNKRRYMVENNSLSCFRDELKKGYWSVIFQMLDLEWVS